MPLSTLSWLIYMHMCLCACVCALTRRIKINLFLLFWPPPPLFSVVRKYLPMMFNLSLKKKNCMWVSRVKRINELESNLEQIRKGQQMFDCVNIKIVCLQICSNNLNWWTVTADKHIHIFCLLKLDWKMWNLINRCKQK